jgi:hypothetical protein
MTTWLRITQIARQTNLSRRYWQRRFARGEVPGARQVQFGQRRLFLADRHQFEAWWALHLLCVSKLTGPQHITALKSGTLNPSSAVRMRERRRRRAAMSAVPQDPEQRSFVFDEDRT